MDSDAEIRWDPISLKKQLFGQRSSQALGSLPLVTPRQAKEIEKLGFRSDIVILPAEQRRSRRRHRFVGFLVSDGAVPSKSLFHCLCRKKPDEETRPQKKAIST